MAWVRAAFSCALAVSLSTTTGAEPSGSVTKRVQASGLAVLAGDDVAAAFESARRAALRQAVEEAVGVLVSSTTRVRNFELIDDHILSATRGYVRSYEVTDRVVVEDGAAYQVTIDAVVDLGILDRDLDALELAIIASDDPRVLCVASLARGEQAVAPNALAEILYRSVSGLAAGLNVSLAPAADPVDDSEADIVVRGHGALAASDAPVPFSNRSVAQSGLVAATAAIDVEARWLDAGRPIAAVTASGRGAGRSLDIAERRALEHAVSLVEDDLLAALAEELRRRAYSTRTVQVIVEGPMVGRRIEDLTRGLTQGLGRVERLQPRGVSADRARFDVDTPLAAFDLARRLSSHGLAGEQVEILQVTANRLRFALADPGRESP